MGRPKGSKNKATAAGTKKRGPGRPKGSKNKATAAGTKKRGPGRPKGSKNKVASAAPKSGVIHIELPESAENIAALDLLKKLYKHLHGEDSKPRAYHLVSLALSSASEAAAKALGIHVDPPEADADEAADVELISPNEDSASQDSFAVDDDAEPDSPDGQISGDMSLDDDDQED